MPANVERTPLGFRFTDEPVYPLLEDIYQQMGIINKLREQERQLEAVARRQA